MAALEDLDLIGITGSKGAGKDTIGQFLVDNYGFQRVAFADPLKEIAITIGWDGSKEDGGTCASCGMLHGRKLLQVLGTEGMREHLGDNVWVDNALRYISGQRLMTGQTRWVIPDVRYQNEANMIRAHGGQVWRVYRSVQDETDNHVSETAMRQIMTDAVFRNDGTIDALHREVEDYAQRIGWHE